MTPPGLEPAWRLARPWTASGPRAGSPASDRASEAYRRPPRLETQRGMLPSLTPDAGQHYAPHEDSLDLGHHELAPTSSASRKGSSKKVRARCAAFSRISAAARHSPRSCPCNPQRWPALMSTLRPKLTAQKTPRSIHVYPGWRAGAPNARAKPVRFARSWGQTRISREHMLLAKLEAQGDGYKHDGPALFDLGTVHRRPL